MSTYPDPLPYEHTIVNIVAKSACGETFVFNTYMYTEDDVHSCEPGDETPFDFETRALSLIDDFGDALRDGFFNEKLGFETQGYEVSCVTRGAVNDVPFLEV